MKCVSVAVVLSVILHLKQIGVNMWFWIVSAIAGSILGSATNSWFADTKLGIWFYKKVDNVSTWASEKLGLKVLEDEEDWKKKYPNINKKIDELEAKIKKLEKKDRLIKVSL